MLGVSRLSAQPHLCWPATLDPDKRVLAMASRQAPHIAQIWSQNEPAPFGGPTSLRIDCQGRQASQSKCLEIGFEETTADPVHQVGLRPAARVFGGQNGGGADAMPPHDLLGVETANADAFVQFRDRRRSGRLAGASCVLSGPAAWGMVRRPRGALTPQPQCEPRTINE